MMRASTARPAFDSARQWSQAWREMQKWPFRWTRSTASHSSSEHDHEHAVAHEAGVVHHDVEAAEGVERRLHERAGLREVRDVGAVRDRLAAGGADLLDDLVRGSRRAAAAVGLDAEVVHDDLRALARERERVGAAEAAAGAGHDHDASVTESGHLTTSRSALHRRCAGRCALLEVTFLKATLRASSVEVRASPSRTSPSEPLEDGDVGLAAAFAHGLEAVAAAGALELG